MMPGATAEACTLCGSPIVAVISEGGRRLELDREPVEDGNIRPIRDVHGRMLARVLGGSQLPALEPAWRRHAETCRESREARARRARLAPRCVVCSEPMDAELAALEKWQTHPCCDPRANADRVRAAFDRAMTS